MKVLVLNCGSSSLKYQLFVMPEARVLAKGQVQKIGEPMGRIEQTSDGGKVSLEEPFAAHDVALRRAVDLLTEGDDVPIQDVQFHSRRERLGPSTTERGSLISGQRTQKV